MRLIATNQFEFGLLAVGINPFGVIALGAFPVGVIAIGGLPMGLVSVACGAGLGGVSFSCGVGVGVYAWVTGVAIGARARAVGLALSLAGEKPERGPTRDTVTVERALERAEESWVRVRVDDEGDLAGVDAPVEMDAGARRQARRLRGQTVHALVRAVESPPAAERGYRKPARPPGPLLHCAAVESAEPRRPVFALFWHYARIAVAVIVALFVLGPVTRERIAMTKMTRVVNATWHARPAQVEGLYLPPDTECRLSARVRSDGTERLDARLNVTCGSLGLVSRDSSDCIVRQHGVRDGHAYEIVCSIARVERSESDDGDTPEQPGLGVDTTASPGHVWVRAEGPPPMMVQLEVDSSSEVVEGEPLLFGADASIDGSRAPGLFTLLVRPGE